MSEINDIDEAIEELARDPRETETYCVKWVKLEANGVISRKETWKTKAKSFHETAHNWEYDCHDYVCEKLRSESDQKFSILKIMRYDSSGKLVEARRYDRYGIVTDWWRFEKQGETAPS